MASLRRRGGIYYIQYYLAGQQRRISLNTDSYQLAKEKQRQFESAQARGDFNPLPAKTPTSTPGGPASSPAAGSSPARMASAGIAITSARTSAPPTPRPACAGAASTTATRSAANWR